MALTLIATAGAVDANTYSTLAEANTYFESRLNATVWAGETDPNKNIALAMATRLFDQGIDWNGLKAASTQALGYPRIGVTDPEGYLVDESSIPDFLKEATAEFAMWLLSSDRTVEDGMKGMRRMKLGNLDLTADKYDRKSVMPDFVYQMVREYGVKKRGPARRLQRTRGANYASDDILTMNIADGRIF